MKRIQSKPNLLGLNLSVIEPNAFSNDQFIYVYHLERPDGILIYHHVVESYGKPVSEWYANNVGLKTCNIPLYKEQ